MIQTRTFRGASYKIECVEGFQHPSHFSFDDESDVRERDWQIRPGDRVMDVGAAYGSYTLTALAADAAKVWAWSPQGVEGSNEADTLLHSLELNGWAKRAEVYRSGFYDRDGWLHTVTQEFYPMEPAPDGAIIAVEPMDAWWERQLKVAVDWVKLDVEGAEVEVLQGGRELIATCRPNLLIENHIFKRPAVLDECRAILCDEHGYREISTHPYHGVSHSLYRHPQRPL